MRWLAVVLCLVAAPVGAESIVAGLSQNRVSITADFDGSEILVYGAVKREAPAPEGALEVIVTVEGPATPVTIRKKDRRAGIWINTEAVHVDAAPSFYAVATTGPLRSILSDTEDLRYRITLPRVIRAVGSATEAGDPAEFIEALQRIRLEDRRYRVLQGAVEFVEETLFRADIVLPANLTEGEYRVRLFLTRDGRVIDAQDRVVGVRKEGLERFLYNLAIQQPWIYGLLSLVMAAVAGWGASTLFRLVRS
ncbi:TIGR02186 family protein [Rhodobacteraceae bacterium HSP-20]|uniref:TIGR02186 family protein n=1 Tax=Paragemmobacter amnigenus TaxID=2852097 RepID=A0ABS6J7X7_9RHOB|nr:TIGR02186 family protein [Rhodobacter amnigenus]MBU9699861.1 TIGR02186 family protein [Rhodobacter amnigenus]MBV4391088.1 TIGR02186 family protein [Rhodobacter amnigenus]